LDFLPAYIWYWNTSNRYYHNITANTLGVLEAMATHGVRTLIYSSTCATYGEPEKMPITEETPQVSCCFCKKKIFYQKLDWRLLFMQGKNFQRFFWINTLINVVLQLPINPYGKAKKMAEDIILDFSKSRKSDMAVMILRLA
jgi:UDP-arabinose 4-epimerase